MLRIHFPKVSLDEFKIMFYNFQKNKIVILAYIQNAQAYSKVGRFERAIEELKEAMKFDGVASRIYNVYLYLGYCYEKIKRYKLAIIQLKKAEEIAPEDSQVNFSLCNCYKCIGQRERSNKELSKGIIKLKDTSGNKSKLKPMN